MSTNELTITFPKPYKHGEKIIKKMDELNENGKKILSSFLGYPEIETMFYLYLFKKYKSDCFLYSVNPGFRLLGLNFNVMTRISKANKKLFDNHIDIIAETFVNCLEKGFKTLIIPVTIFDNRGVSHANLLIYRKKFHQFEHFEPHGAYYMGNENDARKIKKPIESFIEKVNAILKNKGLSEIKYIRSEEVCPSIDGLQSLEAISTLETNAIEDIGYCISWNMFFTELCLYNPNVESSKLLEIAFKYFKDKENIENYLRKVIRGYAIFIEEKVNKYLSALLKQKITTNKINKMYDTFESSYEKFTEIRLCIIELLKLETQMIINKDFNLNAELKDIKKELKENKGDPQLLIKKKVLANYEEFNKFTPVTSVSDSLTSTLSASKIKSPHSVTKKISKDTGITNNSNENKLTMRGRKKNNTKKEKI